MSLSLSLSFPVYGVRTNEKAIVGYGEMLTAIVGASVTLIEIFLTCW